MIRGLDTALHALIIGVSSQHRYILYRYVLLWPGWPQLVQTRSRGFGPDVAATGVVVCCDNRETVSGRIRETISTTDCPCSLVRCQRVSFKRASMEVMRL